jgi:hypothetical protein
MVIRRGPAHQVQRRQGQGAEPLGRVACTAIAPQAPTGSAGESRSPREPVAPFQNARAAARVGDDLLALLDRWVAAWVSVVGLPLVPSRGTTV